MTRDSSAGAGPALRIVRVPGVPKERVRLQLTGHLDADGAPVLAEELQLLLDSGARDVELDLTGVPFMSSMGIGCIIAAVGDFRSASGELSVSGLSPEIRQLLETLDLLDYVKTR